MKLEIVKQGKVEKTYEASTAFLPLGICEDILKAVNIDELIGAYNGTDEQKLKLGMDIIKIVINNFDGFKELLIQTFDGLTEEELRTVDVGDVASIVIEIVQFSIGKLFNITSKKK